MSEDEIPSPGPGRSPDRSSHHVNRLIAAEQAANLAGEAAIRWRTELLTAADAAMTEGGLDEFLWRALAAVKDLLEADTVSFLVANEAGDELTTRHSVGIAERVSLHVDIPMGRGIAGRVMASGTPVIIEDLSSVELASPLLRESGVRSLVAVPVMVDENSAGVLHAGSFQPAYFHQRDVAALTIVADRLGAAMDRVRLFESERRARAGAERIAELISQLQRITVALSGELSEDDVAAVVCQEMNRALGEPLVICGIWMLRDGWLVLTQPDDAPESARSYSRMPVEASYPGCVAIRTGATLWIESRAELERQFPSMSRASKMPDRYAVLPLLSDGAPLGVVAVSFGAEGPFAQHERDFLLAVTEQAAQAFDRSRLRALTARVARQDAFLSALSCTLGESLDFDETLLQIVRLIVPEQADAAAIHLFDDAGGLRRVALAHKDPDTEEAILAAFPGDGHPAILRLLAEVASGGVSIAADVQAVLDEGARGPFTTEVIQAIAPLGIGSVLLAPLNDRGRVLGALTVAQVGNSRTFDEAAHGLLKEVARRAAVAISNTRLLREVREAQRAEKFLLGVATALAGAPDYEETLRRLGAAAVPTLGDLCIIDILDESGTLRRALVHHADPELDPLVDRLREHVPRAGSEHPSAEVILTRRSLWASEMPDELLKRIATDEDHLDLMRRLRYTAFVTVPLVIGGAVFGALSLLSAGSGRRFTVAEVGLAERLAAQVAAVVEKARRYDREHRISHILQSSLLPATLPSLPEVTIAVRYLPGTRDAEVGGDFYDAVRLPNGRLALVIGDVAGHDHQAAAMMGHLRSAIRTLSGHAAGPLEVVETLQHSWDLLGFELMATGIFCQLDPTSGALAMVSAGHPPPLLVSASGADYVNVRPSPPLGAPPAPRHLWQGHMSVSEVLLLYTDGLIDDRRHDLDSQLSSLAVTAANGELHPEALCDRVIAALGSERSDDVAVLAVSLSGLSDRDARG